MSDTGPALPQPGRSGPGNDATRTEESVRPAQTPNQRQEREKKRRKKKKKAKKQEAKEDKEEKKEDDQQLT